MKMIDMYSDYKMEKIPSEFEKRVSQYMECDKRTLAELLAMRDLGIYPYDKEKNGNTPLREPIDWTPVYPNIPTNPITPNQPYWPCSPDNPFGPWPWRLDEATYTTSWSRNDFKISKKMEN